MQILLLFLERQQLFNQYKNELDDILIASYAVHLETVIGEGLLIRRPRHKVYLPFIYVGAFGMVYESVYTNPTTGKSIRVAIKGLKGVCTLFY